MFSPEEWTRREVMAATPAFFSAPVSELDEVKLGVARDLLLDRFADARATNKKVADSNRTLINRLFRTTKGPLHCYRAKGATPREVTADVMRQYTVVILLVSK